MLKNRFILLLVSSTYLAIWVSFAVLVLPQVIS
jgi:hypothetical protein